MQSSLSPSPSLHSQRSSSATKNEGHIQSAPGHDGRVFLGLYILAFITGIYMVVFGSFTATSSTAWVILTGAMVLLALPLIIPVCSSCSYVDTDGPDPAYDDPHKPLLISNSHQMESNAMMQKPKENQMQVKGRLETLGEEHSAKKLFRCVDFWLYYTAYFCGATVGLVYSNNLGQIAQSLHQQSQLTMLLARVQKWQYMLTYY
ncbi:Protein NUCLEAR FUSION DEFECTIVE 4 [Zea mays]|uniref:Protein NUCLEAR FUSION DEFECTIVE 4 n=1 Tax=Zea mays TaxID=4577 RepID=A0A3L6DZF4_MAIZE|nr:Protein NUCLEAR FUSION DEFECTIVE 4 [Zea mays]